MKEFGIFDTLDALFDTPLKDKFAKLHDSATQLQHLHLDALEADLHSAAVLKDITEKATPHVEVLKAHGIAENGAFHLKSGSTSEAKSAFETAQKAVDGLKEQTVNFFKGGSYKIGDVEHKASEAVVKTYGEAVAGAKKVVGPATGAFGIVRTQEKGFVEALKHNGEQMKFWSKGMTPTARGKAFAHGSAAVGSAVLLSDAILRSKNAEGEDRSTASRVLQAVAAGAIGTAALLGGKVALAR
ncbi:MAG: hypothetical protein ACKVOE_03995 [Rickettsiales bacterium]